MLSNVYSRYSFLFRPGIVKGADIYAQGGSLAFAGGYRANLWSRAADQFSRLFPYDVIKSAVDDIEPLPESRTGRTAGDTQALHEKWNLSKLLYPTNLCEDQAKIGFLDRIFLAQHGFSVFIEADKNILFDTGATDLFFHNATLLGIDLNTTDMIALSHGHWDHGNGLKTLVEKGLVIVSGCSHAGICNIVEYARQITHQQELLAVMGGFHLLGNPVQLHETIQYFMKNNVRYLYPMHCTDLPALSKFHETFGISKLCAGDIVEISNL